jgi:hypothetical protein
MTALIAVYIVFRRLSMLRRQQLKTPIVSDEAIIYRPRLTPSNNFFLDLVLASRSVGQGSEFGAGALEPGRVYFTSVGRGIVHVGKSIRSGSLKVSGASFIVEGVLDLDDVLMDICSSRNSYA